MSMSNVEPFISDIVEAICNGTLKTVDIAGCKYIVNPTDGCIADAQYILDTIARKKSKSGQCQEKVSTKEEKIPRGPDRIRQEFEGIVSCIDPLTVHDGINTDSYERQILIRCVAAATTLLKMHFDEEIKKIDHRFDALVSNIFQERITTMPNRNYSDETIVADIDYELSKEARNDTLATDRIARLANRIEFYGLTDAEFAAKNRYWEARVAYLRHGDFPNPGIDRNSPAFTKILKECVEMIRPKAIPDVQKGLSK